MQDYSLFWHSYQRLLYLLLYIENNGRTQSEMPNKDAQDRLDAMDEVSRFPINSAAHQHYAKKEYLRKKANR